MGREEDEMKFMAGACCGFCGLAIPFVTVCIILANTFNLGPEDQIVVVTKRERKVYNGPDNIVLLPHAEKKERTAIRLGARDYAVVKNRQKLIRHEEGPQLLFLDGWEELQEVKRKLVLQRMDYIRLLDRRTGRERIVRGPKLLTPGVFEYWPNGTKQAIVVTPGTAVLILNRTRGIRYLESTPGIFVPGEYEEIVETRSAITITPAEYLIVKNIRTGIQTVIEGPEKVHLSEWDELNCTGATPPTCARPKIVLELDQYVRLVDQRTGLKRVVRGPGMTVPNATEISEGVKTAIPVSKTTTIKLRNTTAQYIYPKDGEYQDNAGVFFPGPTETVLSVEQAILLDHMQYAVVENSQGQKVHELGPQLLRLGPRDKLIRVMDKILLETDDYVRLKNKKTGVIRVVTGPRAVVPTPEELNFEKLPVVEKASFLNTDLAIIVEDPAAAIKRTLVTVESIAPGQQSAVYYPQGLMQVVESRYKQRVLPYQARFYRTAGAASYVIHLPGETFFLPAYAEIVPLRWSECFETCVKRDVDWIDLRRKQMFFKYSVRTQDEYPLEVSGSLFWKIDDVAKLLGPTGSADPVADVYKRAETKLKTHLQSKTFWDFVGNINQASTATFNSLVADEGAYFTRIGVTVTTMELTSFEIKETGKEQQLLSAIQTTVNGIRSRKEQEKNEKVMLARTAANILLQSYKTQLLQQQANNTKLRSEAAGKANGILEVGAAYKFISGLNTSVSEEAKRIELYKVRESVRTRNRDTSFVSAMGATLFAAPSQFNMNVGTPHT